MLKKLFVKYVIVECRHICKLCSYRNECDENYTEIEWKYLWKYFYYKSRRNLKRLLKIYEGDDEKWQ